MIRYAAVAAFALLAACASRGAGPDPVPSQPENACGASQYQYLVGKDRSQVPAAPAGATWRVHSTEEAVTMDYNPRRLNIVWNARTGVVQSVSCG